MKRALKWTLIAAAVLVVLAFTGLSFMAGGPKDALYMVRYALPHMHRGTLKPGDEAPDARLMALDGTTRFHIRERAGAKPLVLVFGSFT
jgi:hypothetical protein